MVVERITVGVPPIQAPLRHTCQAQGWVEFHISRLQLQLAGADLSCTK